MGNFRDILKLRVPAGLCFILALLFVRISPAADTAKPQSPAAAPTQAYAPAQRVHYSLQGLKPLGISQYAVPSRAAQREYIHFQNEQGSHYLIYEEAAASPPVQAIKHFREVMGRWDMVCSLDLECKAPAFCTGTCKNIYYETSNSPEDLELIDRNHCTLISYRCEKPLTKPMASAIQGNE